MIKAQCRRLLELVDYMRAETAKGDTAFQRHLDGGHDPAYLRRRLPARERGGIHQGADHPAGGRHVERLRSGRSGASAAPTRPSGGRLDRSRAGSGPISVRNRTDLEPEVNRSRRGGEPISVRNTTDLGEGGGGAGPLRRRRRCAGR